MNKTINGFDETGIFKLYAYLSAYEDSGIGRHDGSTKKLLEKHPELSELEECFKLVKYHKAKCKEMKILDFKKLNNEVYLTCSKANLQLSLLAHLRNAIAHGSVVGHNGKVLVTDFHKDHPVDFTARGRVDFEIVEKFTEIINKIEL